MAINEVKVSKIASEIAWFWCYWTFKTRTEEYRYDCEGYKISVSVADELLEQLISWANCLDW